MFRTKCYCVSYFEGALSADGYATSVGDEGGFAPNFKSDTEALDYIVKAIEAMAMFQVKTSTLLLTWPTEMYVLRKKEE